MPFNGSGVFQRVRNWVADAAAGIKIRADYHDAEDDGFAAGLSNCITKDGQTIVTQNIPMNSKRITGLARPGQPAGRRDQGVRRHQDVADGRHDDRRPGHRKDDPQITSTTPTPAVPDSSRQWQNRIGG